MCVWSPCCLGVCEGPSDVNLKYNFSGALYLVFLRQGLPPAPPYAALLPNPQKCYHKHMPTTHLLFLWGLEELNSGSHACAANPLPTELYLRPNKSYKRWKALRVEASITSSITVIIKEAGALTFLLTGKSHITRLWMKEHG